MASSEAVHACARVRLDLPEHLRMVRGVDVHVERHPQLGPVVVGVLDHL